MMSYKGPYFFSFLVYVKKPIGFFFRRITTYARDSPPLRKADDAPISGSCVHKSMPRARSRWLLRRSSRRHSPLDALDLGYPQLSLHQGRSKKFFILVYGILSRLKQSQRYQEPLKKLAKLIV